MPARTKLRAKPEIPIVSHFCLEPAHPVCLVLLGRTKPCAPRVLFGDCRTACRNCSCLPVLFHLDRNKAKLLKKQPGWNSGGLINQTGCCKWLNSEHILSSQIVFSVSSCSSPQSRGNGLQDRKYTPYLLEMMCLHQ